MKFGGTSMAGIERIRHVAGLVKREVERGHEVAVVVSAMAGETDRLVQFCREAASVYDPREYDVVVASGEQVTSGLLAITSHYQPLTLRVQPGRPVMTDPNATIAWSGNLNPQLKADVSLKTFLGRGSGESMQMRFEGDGFVIVQPYEEVYMQASAG